jgi:hypothetical protein
MDEIGTIPISTSQTDTNLLRHGHTTYFQHSYNVARVKWKMKWNRTKRQALYTKGGGCGYGA